MGTISAASPYCPQKLDIAESAYYPQVFGLPKPLFQPQLFEDVDDTQGLNYGGRTLVKNPAFHSLCLKTFGRGAVAVWGKFR